MSREDRRGTPRSAATFRVRYRSLDEFVVAYTTNISEGGMFVLSDDPLPVGTTVQVSLELPDETGEGPVVPCVARVAYLQSGDDGDHRGMGLELTDVPSAIIQTLLLDALDTDSHPEQAIAGTADARILIVDDEKNARDHTANAVKRFFPNVELANDGLDALGKALSNPPDLVLSDVEMPGMDGWQLVRILRSRPNLAGVPIVLLTRLQEEGQRLRGYQLGVDDYLPKPIDADDLLARVRGLLLRTRGQAPGQDGLRGDVGQVSVASVLSFLEQERRSGTLLVVHQGSLAVLFLDQGRVVRAQVPREAAHLPTFDGLFFVLSWDTGRFEFSPQKVAPDPDEVGISTSALLLEWARHRDEATRRI